MVVEVIEHLQRIKPKDGWSLSHKSGGRSSAENLVRLLRKNVPVTDSYFLDIVVHGGTKQKPVVVGILTKGQTTVQGQVLVNESGKVIGSKNIELVTIHNYTPSSSSTTSTFHSTTTNSSSPPQRSTTSNRSTSDIDNEKILKYGGIVIAGAVLARILATPFIGPFVLLPLLFLFLVHTCPVAGTFDAKKELKRIMRGHYLPEEHPKKPKGMFQETIARLAATVTTEVATGIAGYSVQTMSLPPIPAVLESVGPCCILQTVYVPSIQFTYYFLGVHNRWYLVHQIEDRTS